MKIWEEFREKQIEELMESINKMPTYEEIERKIEKAYKRLEEERNC